MSGSSTIPNTPSSGPLLKGTFSVIEYAEMIVKDYKAAISQAIKDIADEEQEITRNMARSSDSDWSTLADKIKVQYNEEERMLRYSVDTSEEETTKVQNLEFGHEHTAPNPILRTAAARGKDTFGKRVVNNTYGLLFGSDK
jgi:predicted metalloprotease with PDZ domain